MIFPESLPPPSNGNDLDQHWMEYALALAHYAGSCDEVPVGAVLTLGGQLLGRGWNQPITLNDPTAHAEIMALREAAKFLGNYRLPGTTLYVTLEPCSMCAGALLHARVQRLVFATSDPRSGACGSVVNLTANSRFNHRFTVESGLCQEVAASLLQDFFRARRGKP